MKAANPRDIRAANWARLTDEDSHIAARIGRVRVGRWSAYRDSQECDALQIATDMHGAKTQGRGVVQRLQERYGVPGHFDPIAAQRIERGE